MELCRQAWRAIAGGLGALVLFAAWPAAAAVWTPDHVVIVIEENLSPRNLVPELTYLTGLMRDNANFTNSHAIDHPSQPNYLALFSGDAQGTGSEAKRNPDGSNPIVGGHTQVGTDDPPADTPLDTPNLGAALIRAGHSFAGYAEDLPYPGFTGISHTGPAGSGIDYQRKHNPWVNWQAASDAAIGRNQLPSTVNLPFTAFPTDDAGFARLPNWPSSYPIRSTMRTDHRPLRPGPITVSRWTPGCAPTSSPTAAGR